MKEEVKVFKEYGYRKTNRYTLKKKDIVSKTEWAKAPFELTDATSDFIDKVVTIDAAMSVPMMQDIPKHMRIFKGFLNILKLGDDTTQFLNLHTKVKLANNINNVLNKEREDFVGAKLEKNTLNFIENYSKIGNKATSKIKSSDFEGDTLNYFEDYNIIKSALKENRELYAEQKKIAKEAKKKLGELYKKEIVNGTTSADLSREIEEQKKIFDKAKARKNNLIERRAYLKNIRERVIIREISDLNKENRFLMGHRILGNIANFATTVIELLVLPVNKVIIAGLQIPTLFGKLVSKIGEHVVRRFKEKAEASRRDNALDNQIKVIEDVVGKEKFKEIIKEEEDKQKQKEILEKSEDENVKLAVKISKGAQKVFCAKPKWYLRMFKPNVFENEERIQNVAKSIFAMVKELPDIEKAELDINNTEIKQSTKELVLNGLSEAKAEEERLKTMLDIIGIGNADDYIRDVKYYHNKKKEHLKEVKLQGSDEIIYARMKNELRGKIEEAMKQKI